MTPDYVRGILMGCMARSLTDDEPEVLSIDEDIFVQWVSHQSGLQVEIGLPNPERRLSPQRVSAMGSLGFAAPTLGVPSWWMVVGPEDVEAAATAIIRALLILLEVPVEHVAKALANCAQGNDQGTFTALPDLDIVGSVAMTDDDGELTGVSLLLTRGMDTTGIAETFRTERRVDMDGGAMIRRPGEPDDAFAARLQAVIDVLVADDPPMSPPTGTLATEVRG